MAVGVLERLVARYQGTPLKAEAQLLYLPFLAFQGDWALVGQYRLIIAIHQAHSRQRSHCRNRKPNALPSRPYMCIYISENRNV